jgi:hypothetical protein
MPYTHTHTHTHTQNQAEKETNLRKAPKPVCRNENCSKSRNETVA